MSHETTNGRPTASRETKMSYGEVCFASHKVCVSKLWYFASIVVFVFVAVTAALANEVKRHNQADKITGAVYEIGTQFVSPAPSVRLFVTSAPWCGPCQRLHPILEELKERGYDIEIDELREPNKPSVPFFEFYQFGELVREQAGIPKGESPRDFVVSTFEEIENSIFTPRGEIRKPQ